MKDKPGHGDGHYKGDCDVADEIDIQQTYDGAGSGPVDLPHGYLLGTATDDEGHEDNQTEVCHDKAQQGEYQHQIPGVEFIAVHGAVNVAKRYEIALPVRKYLCPCFVQFQYGLIGTRIVYPHHKAELEEIAVQHDKGQALLKNAGIAVVLRDSGYYLSTVVPSSRLPDTSP